MYTDLTNITIIFYTAEKDSYMIVYLLCVYRKCIAHADWTIFGVQ